MRRAGLLVVLLVLGLCGSAQAITLVTPDGRIAQPYQRWADGAKVPTAPATVVVELGPDVCGGADGCAAPALIGIKAVVRAQFYHELGHEFDYFVMTDASRAGFQRIMRDRRPWRSPPNSPHEQFAEAYSICALGITVHRALETIGIAYGYAPSERQHRRVCALIRRASRSR